MSAYHQIFIHTAQPLATVLGDLSAISGAEMTKRDGEPVDYSASLANAALELQLAHEFEEDFGIPFERYELLLEVRDYDRDLDRQEQTARQVFEALAQTGRYALVLVRDLQGFVDASPPLPGAS